jgi:hypothetical protein
VIPVLGQLSRTLIGILTFIVALVLSVVTILMSIVLHHLLLMVAMALILAAVVLVGVVPQRHSAPIALSTA